MDEPKVEFDSITINEKIDNGYKYALIVCKVNGERWFKSVRLSVEFLESPDYSRLIEQFSKDLITRFWKKKNMIY